MAGVVSGWMFPDDTERRALDLPAMHALLDPSAEVDGAQDWPMRQAEFWNVMEIAREVAGRRFVTKEAARSELFDHASGGGFGIRNAVVDEFLDLMATVGVAPPVAPTPIPLEAQELLGVYVYALRDPTDGRVFYVGKGRGNRIFSHVWSAMGVSPAHADDKSDALGAEDVEAVRRAKINRIRSILDSGFGVEHWVLRHRIEGDADADSQAFAIEQTLIDGLQLALPASLTNIAGGHTRTALGMLQVEELVLRYSAEPAPPLPTPCGVIKVNATANPNATDDKMYEWSRRAWQVGADLRAVKGLPIIVFANDIVRAVYRAQMWGAVRDQNGRRLPKVWEFTGDRDADLEARYVGKSLREVRAARSDRAWRQHGWHPYR